MTISHTPSPARSDVRTGIAAVPATTRPYRLHGRMLSIGAVAWALSTALVGTNPTETPGLVVFGIGSGCCGAPRRSAPGVSPAPRSASRRC